MSATAELFHSTDAHYADAYFCSCRLYPFPTKRQDEGARERWKKAVNRCDVKRPWVYLEPTKEMHVCSEHFVDGKPTLEHPDPTLNLGYDANEPRKKIRRTRSVTADVNQLASLPVDDANMASFPGSPNNGDCANDVRSDAFFSVSLVRYYCRYADISIELHHAHYTI
jgi:hypothetical protein